MIVLVVATNLSDTMETIIIEQSLATANNLLILVTNEGVKNELERLGFETTLLSYHINHSWEERDKLFKKVAMPGEILDIDFPDTNLPVWEILSLDRLSFFFNGEESIKQIETLELLEWDKAIVSLDIHSHLPFIIAVLSRQKNVDCIACQVANYLPTEEMESLIQSNYLSLFSSVVIGKREDGVWLSELLNTKSNGIPTIRDLGGSYPKVVFDAQKKGDYRRGFGFTETDTVLFIVFDLPTEHEFGKYLLTINPKDKVLIWPVDDRAREKIGVLAGERINRVNGIIVNGLDYHRASDKVIYFRRGSFLPDLSVPSELWNG